MFGGAAVGQFTMPAFRPRPGVLNFPTDGESLRGAIRKPERRQPAETGHRHKLHASKGAAEVHSFTLLTALHQLAKRVAPLHPQVTVITEGLNKLASPRSAGQTFLAFPEVYAASAVAR